MFNSLKAVTYRVPDLGKARQWYCRVLGRDPVFAAPFAVVFTAGDSMLTLLPYENTPGSHEEGVIAYWDVKDVDAACQRSLDLGAGLRGEAFTSALGSRVAKVVDPFGNVLGLMSRPAEAKEESLEDRPSESALGVALCRAAAAKEIREEIRGADHLAELFLNDAFKRLLADPAGFEWLMKKVPGSYEFFIARSAYFDHIVQGALRGNMPQIVLLGAGYDTRFYRFMDLIKGTRLFELDITPTQQRKKRILKQANVLIPPQLTFVSINFEKDSLKDILAAAGFDKNRRTLFLWEGVIYYLPAESVDQTMEYVRLNSPPGSILCFDYLADAPDMAERYGVRESRAAMQAAYRAEPVQFRIKEGTINAFLNERGFSLIEHLTTEDMERKYLILRDGSLAGRVLACFRLVQASV